MWTGTPYDKWQKRLGVTFFITVLVTGALTGFIPPSDAFPLMHALFAIAILAFIAMVGLLALKKIYLAVTAGRAARPAFRSRTHR